MKKFLTCLVVLTAAACIFSACGTQSGSEKNTQEPSSELSTTLSSDTHESISYAITQEEARGIADEALKNAMTQNEFGIGEDDEIFAFESIELLPKDEQYSAFNAGYGNTSETENTTGHAYYAVEYTDTSQIAGFAYICVDAVTGDVLYTGYMGD